MKLETNRTSRTMIVGALAAEAAQTRRAFGRSEIDGSPEGWTTDYILGSAYKRTGAETRPLPQAFTVEKRPGAVTLPHFHFEEQFQVFVGGSAKLGRHAVSPTTVHYAAAHTGYGPIVAGPEGLKYFTLREVADEGAHYLPGARDRQDRKAPKQSLTSDPVVTSEAATLRDIACEIVIPRQASGVAAWMLRVPHGRRTSQPGGPRGGRFLIVIGGAIEVGGTSYPQWSPIFVSAGEGELEVVAGEQGADVLVVQFAVATGRGVG